MQSHFYAYMARMKLIKRWGLRRSTIQENDQEHSHLVSMIAHALALIKNTRYGGNVDPGRVTLLAVWGLAIWWTYAPPQLPLFVDPTDGSRGIPLR